MKNIHISPTEIPGRFSLKSNGEYCLSNYSYPDSPNFKNQNIYITSDEEIKEGEWHLHYYEGKPVISKSYNGAVKAINEIAEQFSYKKIILTTDADLINEGIQEITDEFLEWFVKNPSCEFVMTIPDVIGLRDVFQPTGKDLYKIIIPKEEDFELVSIGEETVKLVIPMIQYREEIKQETLEEAAERLYPTTINSFTDSGFDTSETERLIFKNGAKWQQEQEQNNENSWFNEYQKVEDYIIKRIGDKFLDATPEKYNTASEATIALLEDNWEQNKNSYSEEQVKMLMFDFYYDMSHKMNVPKNLISENATNVDEWFKQYKKK